VSSRPKLLLDVDTLRIVYANRAAAALAGSARDALIGSVPWTHHVCWERDELEARLAPLRDRTQDAISYELGPRGGAPAMDVQAQRVSSEDGPAYLVWTGHDVAAHRRIPERPGRSLTAGSDPALATVS
jgi:PAS domain-containing protein